MGHVAALQAWRAVHPPSRGNYWLRTQPLVHRGFLHCYMAEGLNTLVLGKVEEILAVNAGSGSQGGQSWRVIFTGHRLGTGRAPAWAPALDTSCMGDTIAHEILPGRSCLLEKCMASELLS